MIWQRTEQTSSRLEENLITLNFAPLMSCACHALSPWNTSRFLMYYCKKNVGKTTAYKIVHSSRYKIKFLQSFSFLILDCYTFVRFSLWYTFIKQQETTPNSHTNNFFAVLAQTGMMPSILVFSSSPTFPPTKTKEVSNTLCNMYFKYHGLDICHYFSFCNLKDW